LIASEEKCDITTVQLAALLHDIADKFHGGDETIGPKTSRIQTVPAETIDHVVKIII
jgi:uncharacterized protein